MIDFKAKPFNLNNEQEKWVKDTLDSMTLDDKIGQILCPSLSSFDDKTIYYYTKVLKVGSVMIRPFDADGLTKNIENLQNCCSIPLLISANLENGGCGAIMQGTLFANPLGCAAAGDKENGYRLGKVSCSEASAVGVNWGFAPIVDIDRNFHNPITNVRTFGSDVNTVLNFSREYIRGATEEGVLPTIKHFPGDGVDERDQHLLVSVNDYSYDDWMNTYGMIYKTLIEEGAPVVMAGHISAPLVAKAVNERLSSQEKMLPASQSKTLLTELLRNKLGFNGLIVTDSTLMVGYMQYLPRRVAIPYSIECGADVILFNRSISEDIEYLKDGVKNGILSNERLNEAVARMLALKATQNLRCGESADKKKISVEELIASDITMQWKRECADKAVTLVKDERNLLPLSPAKTKRIYLNVIENVADNNSPFAKDIKRRLLNEGFKVTLRKRKYSFNPDALTLEKFTPAAEKAMKEIMCSTSEFVSQYDLAMIVVNMQTASNATVVRVNWNVLFGMGNDLPWYAGEIPLIVVSTNNPYHLLDIPMAHTYINTYTPSKETLDAAMDKLMGRSEFKGVSPVDAFCGKIDTRI